MWPSCRGKLPNCLRTPHREPVGINVKREAPNTPTYTQTNTNNCALHQIKGSFKIGDWQAYMWITKFGGFHK